MHPLTIGDTVRWANPNPDESPDARYIIIELNGDRCFIRLVNDWIIPPVTLARVKDLVLG